MCLYDKLSKHARAIARTVSAQSVLRYLIKRQETISYEALAEAIDMAPDGGFVRILATVARQDKNDGRALTTAIVVGKGGMPSAGFFDHAERQGWFDPWDYAGRSPDEGPEMTDDEIDKAKRSFWLEQLEELGYAARNEDDEPVLIAAPATEEDEAEPTVGRRRQVGVATVETVVADD